MKRSLVIATASVASMLLFGHVAVAQSNPFVPQNQGTLTRQQVEEIARKTAEEQAKAAAASSAAGQATPGPGPAGVDTSNIQPQPGAPGVPGVPNGSPVAGGPPVALTPFSDDPVAALIEAGGTFVGCVRETPIFRDKVGRRVYFTTKEIKDSGAARRYARC